VHKDCPTPDAFDTWLLQRAKPNRPSRPCKSVKATSTAGTGVISTNMITRNDTWPPFAAARWQCCTLNRWRGTAELHGGTRGLPLAHCLTSSRWAVCPANPWIPGTAFLSPVSQAVTTSTDTALPNTMTVNQTRIEITIMARAFSCGKQIAGKRRATFQWMCREQHDKHTSSPGCRP
jgi:hypothetical protein